MTKLVGGLGGAIGCRFLKNRNQLVFVEYAGKISLLDMVRPVAATISQGNTVLQGTYSFDFETGQMQATRDIFWEQIDNIKRRMVPTNGAGIINLGIVDFNSITPAVLQTLAYSSTPINGNNDATNQLVNGDVFAVMTNEGNYAKVKITQYGYNLSIQWVTYKLNSPYHVIGVGYNNPEDIAVSSDETTAYVTERTGNLVKVNLNNANRAAAVVVATGMNAPHQIYLDEIRQQAYVVEYANPGRLIRINLQTGQKTILLNNLNNAIGLLISSDLAYAYISEQSNGGRVTRYSLQGGTPLQIASGLTNPFFLTWLDSAQTTILVPERDLANRVKLVNVLPNANNVQVLTTNVAFRPSSVAYADTSRLLVCCNEEIDVVNTLESFVSTGIFKGIGLVPWNMITAAGVADTTVPDPVTNLLYPYQFEKNAPFGGTLSLQINHSFALTKGVKYYRVKAAGNTRFDSWTDVKMNPANGKYEIYVQFKPDANGFYEIHQPGDWFMNTDLGLILNSTSLSNGLQNFTIEFADATKTVIPPFTHQQNILIDNNHCVASIEMPMVGNNQTPNPCGMLKFTNTMLDIVTITYVASHPTQQATRSFSIIKGLNSITLVPDVPVSGLPVNNAPFTIQRKAADFLGACPAAAFSAYVYVSARAINGISRQSQYDRSAAVAFALTP